MMRGKSMAWTMIGALLVSFYSLNSAAASKIKVNWYKPKVVKSETDRFSKITLYGRTRSNIPISVDLKKAYTIKNESKEKNWNSGLENQMIKSNARGFFKISLEMPQGLIQVPIYFNKYLDTPGEPILLTMKVEEDAVKLNVLVSRRPKKKAPPAPVVATAEDPSPTPVVDEAEPENFEDLITLGAGLIYVFHTQSTDYSGIENEFESSGLGVKLWGMWEFSSWSSSSSFAFVPVSGDSSIGGSTVSKADISMYQLRSDALLSIGGEGNRAVWLVGGVDYLNQPLLTSGTDFKPVELSALRARIGLQVDFNSDSGWWYSAAAAYLHPLSLSISEGEIEYESTSVIHAEIQIAKRYEGGWTAGSTLSYEMNNYDYKFTDNSRAALNDGSNAVQIIQFDLNATYSF